MPSYIQISPAWFHIWNINSIRLKLFLLNLFWKKQWRFLSFQQLKAPKIKMIGAHTIWKVDSLKANSIFKFMIEFSPFLFDTSVKINAQFSPLSLLTFWYLTPLLPWFLCVSFFSIQAKLYPFNNFNKCADVKACSKTSPAFLMSRA